MDMTVAGMLSGTSFDAIDVAIAHLSIDEDTLLLAPLGLHSEPMPEDLRRRIAQCLPPHRTTMEEVCRLDTALGQLFGQVGATAIDRAVGAVDLVVSHGQTVYHWVEGGRARGTLQLGSAAWIAEATSCPVVSDLRTRDLTRGGQGAPLASILDVLLLLPPGKSRGCLNLGGIANITVRCLDDTILAYDIGPANALLDGYLAQATGGVERMDRDGAHAARGSVLPGLLDRLLAHPYYEQDPPKSTGKEVFNADYVAGAIDSDVDLDDVMATLCELTARTIATACAIYGLEEMIVSGGGINNPVLMSRIAALAGPTAIRPVDGEGLPAQGKEAYLFALLGYLSVHGIAGSLPSATGASSGAILGSLTPGAVPLRLPQPLATTPSRLEIVGQSPSAGLRL